MPRPPTRGNGMGDGPLDGVPRRALLQRGLVVAGGLVAASTLAGAGGLAGALPAAKKPKKTTVSLTDYPYFPGTVIVADQALLDGLATDYATAQGKKPLAMTRFLFGEVPVRIFDQIFTTKNPATALDVGSYLWLFHLSGYFGGVWLRGELVKTGKNPTIAGFSSAQSQQAFSTQAEKAQRIVDAASGSESGVLAYNQASLFDQPDPANPASVQRGLADTFGYNEGYLLQIAEAPPVGLTTPAGFVTCPADAASRPLYCAYGTYQLKATRTFDPVSTKLAAGRGGYAALKAQIPPIQQSAIARGRQVWNSFLNVQGFSQTAYEQLLDISSAFLETVQATALASVEAVADQDAPLGRQAATANACMSQWLASYTVGLIDGRPDRALPTFAQ
jgi:hypothetical protein